MAPICNDENSYKKDYGYSSSRTLLIIDSRIFVAEVIRIKIYADGIYNVKIRNNDKATELI